MPAAAVPAQSRLVQSFTPSECLDEGFALARGLLRGPALPVALVPMAAGLALVVLGWLGLLEDAVLTQAGFVRPDRLQELSSGRLALVAAVLWAATLLGRRAWDALRGPLPPGPGLLERHLGALVMGPVGAVVIYLPFVVLLGALLGGGEAGLLPLQWLDRTRPLPWLGVLFLGLLVWPAVRLAPAVLAVEGGGPLRALGRGFLLNIASGGRAAVLQVLVLLLQLIVGCGVAALLGLLLGVPDVHATAPPLLAGLVGDLPLWAGLSLGYVAVEALLAPQLALAWLLAYVDVRVRREGLDVEALGRAAGLLEGEPER